MAKLLRASATAGGGATQVELDAFTGTTNIATLGTVGTGTWEGTTVAVAQGGTGVTSKTGTGNVVLSSSPTLVTPALGTPASGVATNITGIPAANLTGTITSGTQDAITRLGTVASGVWEGTDVGVPHGGTGVSTLTDGGVLLGSGTGAITATAVLADGEMLVGDGSTDPAIESGATLRTSIGLGNVDNTADASQTSLGTVTSGTWQGTTVAVNQGGTGATTHTANNVLIGAGTSAITSIAPGADGEVLTSTGSVWQSEAAGGGGVDGITSSANATAIAIDSSENVVFSGGTVHTVGWTTHTWSFNTGFSSSTSNWGAYKRIGRIVFITGSISGTSNSALMALTNAPYTAASTQEWSLAIGRAYNGGATTAGIMGWVYPSGTDIRFSHNGNWEGFTASGSKSCIFSGWYEAASDV